MHSHVKLLCILLSLALLCPLLLSACQKTAEPTLDTSESTDATEAATEKTEDGPLVLAKDGKSEYTIIRPTKYSDVLLSAVSRLYQSFQSSVGTSVVSKTDSYKKDEVADADAKEILIGNTNRPESAQVLSELGNNDFLIKAVGNKIVIVAKSDALLIHAVQCFIDEYVASAESTKEVLVARDLVRIGENSDAKVVTENSDGTLNIDLSYFVITYNSTHELEFVPSAAKGKNLLNLTLSNV